jgi:hypothetical protein
MALMLKTVSRKQTSEPRATQRIPRALRARVELLLNENYAFMDSPVFRRKGIEQELFGFEIEPALPRTAWYQPTRDEMLDSASRRRARLLVQEFTARGLPLLARR